MWVIENKSGGEIAKVMGFSRSAILGTVRRRGLLRGPGVFTPKRGRKRTYRDPDKMMIDRYHAGSSISDIAKTFGTQINTIKARLIALGLDPDRIKTARYEVHPMWGMDEDARRQAFIDKFNKGWAGVLKRVAKDRKLA
jgi:hypothetical protein